MSKHDKQTEIEDYKQTRKTPDNLNRSDAQEASHNQHALFFSFTVTITTMIRPGDTYLRRFVAERGTSADGLPRPKRVPTSDEQCRNLGRRRGGCHKN